MEGTLASLASGSIEAVAVPALDQSQQAPPHKHQGKGAGKRADVKHTGAPATMLVNTARCSASLLSAAASLVGVSRTAKAALGCRVAARAISKDARVVAILSRAATAPAAAPGAPPGAVAGSEMAKGATRGGNASSSVASAVEEQQSKPASAPALDVSGPAVRVEFALHPWIGVVKLLPPPALLTALSQASSSSSSTTAVPVAVAVI
jgi:hypothetical protein